MDAAIWKRRSFLHAAGLAGLATFASSPANLVKAGAPDRRTDFARALRANPMLLGWRSASADRLDCEARVEGRLPAELVGTLYRNGPAVHERFGQRYAHWFDGDGMVQAWRFDGDRVSHRGRVVMTLKLAREEAAGRRLVSGFGTHIEDGAPLRRPDDLNAANISVLDHHGELLALWEGGSASLLDRETLAWRAFKVWGERLEGVPFTAHPKVEPDGTLWGFGYAFAPAPALLLYHIGGDGGLRKVQRVDAGPLGMVHDFVVTARHLVIVIPPLVFEPAPGRNLLLDVLVWRPELGSRALVVEKGDFDARRWYQLPAGFGFHHGNAWEEADGTIRFDHCVAADATLMSETMRFVMRGEFRASAPERYTRFALHPGGRAEVGPAGDEAEFPRIAPALTGRRNRYVYTLGAPSGHVPGWRLRRMVKRDLERDGATESFDYGPGVLPEEHVFVPRHTPGAEDDGWLLGPFLDYSRGASGIAVFDARHVPDGPVARAWLDYPLPLAFHGNFSAA